MTVPATMQAAVLEAYGAPLRLSEIARPVAGPGQVLVRIVASGVNPLDVKIQAGAGAHAHQSPPAVLGLDLAGIVEAVGRGVTGFRRGDEVFGLAGGVGGHQGSLAEYMAVDASLLAIKAANMSMREAATMPLTFITAWEGLVDRAAVKAGQNVLVQGGAGGVGRMAVQIACALGASVFATGSTSSQTSIERLGATFIDREEPVPDYVERLTNGVGFDVVYDTVGGTVLDASFGAVRRFGHVVSCLGWGSHALAPLSFKAATYSGVFTLLPLLTGHGAQRHGEILAEATRLAEAGQLVPSLDARRFSLRAVSDAYDAIAKGDTHGKLVIDIGAADLTMEAKHVR
jgi:NADPH2:quinone reductase